MKVIGSARVVGGDEVVPLNVESFFSMRIDVEQGQIVYKPINNQETI